MSMLPVTLFQALLLEYVHVNSDPISGPAVNLLLGYVHVTSDPISGSAVRVCPC